MRASHVVATGLAAALGSAASLGLYFHEFATSNYEIKDVPIKTDLNNPDLYGMKGMALADPHIGSHNMTIPHLNAIIDDINLQNPDIVFLLGDYINASRNDFRQHEDYTVAQIVAAFARIEAPTVAVLGNHDFTYIRNKETGHRESLPQILFDLFKQHEIPLLINESIPIEIEDKGTLWVAGITDFNNGQGDYDAAVSDIPEGADAVFLTHSPDAFSQIDRDFALAVAGDTHCGQVNVFNIIPAQHAELESQKTKFGWYCGEYKVNETPAYVSSGLGTSTFPIRIGEKAKSRVEFFEFQPLQQPQQPALN